MTDKQVKLERALFFLAAAFLVLVVVNSALAATVPSYTVSLYKGTTKVTDVSADTEIGAFLLCFEHAKTIQANTTSKVVCKTPVLSLVTVPDPPPLSATLSWTPPTQNTDGSALADLAGYRVFYGTTAGSLTQTVNIGDPKLTSYVLSGLQPGTYYFGIKAYNTAGVESELSPIVSKTL